MYDEIYVEFVQAIHNKRKIRLSYYAEKHGEVITRLCIPYDFGPLRSDEAKKDRYHFHDCEGSKGGHTASILSENVRGIEVLEEGFEPKDYITWDTKEKPWHIKRDWGEYS